MKRNLKYLSLLALMIPILLLTGCLEGESITSDIRIIDTSGNANGIDTTGGSLDVNLTNEEIVSKDYANAIAHGDIVGHDTWSKVGYNDDIGVALEDLWEMSTQYVFPTIAQQMRVVSSDDINDKVGGNGALSVYIIYLDDSYVEHEEIITLNGTTPVNTIASNIYRINYFRLYSTGSTGVAAGNISLTSLDGVTTYAYISAGYTIDRTAVYTVPDGIELFITSITYTSTDAAKGVRFILKTTYDDVINQGLTAGTFFVQISEVALYNSAISRTFEFPQKIPEHTDIKVSVVSSQTGSVGVVYIRGWEEII
jgi:hypothetical protein